MPDNLPPSEQGSVSSRPQKPATKPTSLAGSETKPTNETRYDAHFIMQAKGGVGKSFASWLLAQWHAERAIPVSCFDTDPLNTTFSSFEALKAEHVKIFTGRGQTVNVDGMDGLIESIIVGSGAAIVDNGAASFVPMASYLLSNAIPSVLADHNRRLVIHTIVVGGQLALETLAGMVALLEQFPPSVPVVVWVNEHTKPFEAEGLQFTETAAYKKHQDRIAGVIYLANEDPQTHGRDVAAMLDRHLTFNEAVASGDFKIVARSRLLQVRDTLFAQLDRVLPAI